MKNATISATDRTGRSILAAVLALLVLVWVIPIFHSYANPMDQQSLGGPRKDEEDVHISKTCIQRPGQTDEDFTEDGYPVYDMNLTFNGFGDDLEEREPIDVMFIVDVSGSMAPTSAHPRLLNGQDVYGGNTLGEWRTIPCANAINEFVRLADEAGYDARYSMIEFAGHYKTTPGTLEHTFAGSYYNNDYNSYYGDGSGYHDAAKVIDWTQDTDIENHQFVDESILRQDVPGRVNNQYTNGSFGHLTNYDAGLYTAKQELEAVQDNGRKKVVIFLTDGNPNRYYDENGLPQGKNSTGLVPQAATVSNARAGTLPLGEDDYFYGVAFSEANDPVSGASYSIANMTDAVADATGAHAKPFANENASGLSDTITEVFEDLHTRTITTCTKVTIHDVMSDNVEFYGTDADIRVMRTYLDDNGDVQEVDDTENWVISHQGKKIDATHNDAVDPNSNYRLTYPVRASDQTRQDYTTRDFAADGEYPNLADTDTGTYSGQPGYDTNIQSPETPDGTGTYVDFTKDVNVNGTHTETDFSKPYDEPVIRQHRLIITKTINGVDDLSEEEVNQLVRKLTFTVAGSNVKDNTETPRFSKTVNYNTTQSDGTVALSDVETTTDDSGKKTYTFHYTMNVPGGESYTITESNAELALHDWSAGVTEQTIPIDTNSEGYASFTNNYELYLNLYLHKAALNSDPIKYLDGAKFQLYEVVEGDLTPVGDEIEVADGEAGIKLKLHDGSYILRETRAPDGYMLADDVAFEVVGGHIILDPGNSFAFAQELEPSGDEEAASSLTIYDVKIFELPSAGGSGLYGYIIGGTMMIVFSATALARNLRRKRGGAAE